ncbi:hypothetical protein [Hymenobacter cellulosilyticus]|uniref:Uncharacterized protein n=1 Tax=Hymenobacter cellulosilyticus TaxID=2932248 RepID=A0A8T9QGC3_9BACT|nr:hypothetical protein [Hymenobacter cellulosilyticus]UOQ74619.1 hypothetical protein MUN79_12550 [Hymenobacter cellulosilyticus]
MADFVFYQQFPNPEVAAPLLELLRQHEVPFETSLDKPSFDPSFAHNETSTHYVVKLQAADFEKVRALEEAQNQELIRQVDPSHYLFTFTDTELADVLLKPDEWNSFDVTLARQILQDRGTVISPEAARLLRQQRNADLAQPEPSQKAWILWGYATALLGGLFAFFIGWHLYTHRKTLPDGRKVHAFTAPDRLHGLRIMVLGAVMLVLLVCLRIYSKS